MGRRLAADAPLATAVALLALPVAALSYLNRHQQIDDALIYQRYVRNVLEGHGLVYNVGEAFNGLTSPLYAYLALAASATVGDVQVATMILSALCLLLAIGVFAAVFARAADLTGALAGALLMGSARFFYFTYGLETPLFVLLIGVCLWLFERRRDFGLGIACALLLLTRGEGLFLVLSLALLHRRQGRPWPAARCFAVPALLLAGQLLFNVSYYGQPWPHTVSAKIYQGSSGLWAGHGFQNVGYHYAVFFSRSGFLVAALAALGACGLWSLRRSWLTAAALPFLAMFSAFYLVLRIPNYHWYYGPFYAFGFFYAGAGISWLLGKALAVASPRWRRVALAAAATLSALTLLGNAWITPGDLAHTGPIREYRTLGLWLEENTAPDATVAAVEIGALGWYSRRTIVDILGLVTPENARFLGERRLGAWIERWQPDYAVAHVPPWPHERGILRAARRGEYAPEERFRHPLLRLYRRRGA